MSYETPQNEKQALGHLAYVLEAMGRLNSIDHYCAHVEYDGGTVDGDFIFGGVSNSTSVAGMVRLRKDLVSLCASRLTSLWPGRAMARPAA